MLNPPLKVKRIKMKICRHCKKEFDASFTLNTCCSPRCISKYLEAKDKEKRKVLREKKKVSLSVLTIKADKIFGEYIRKRDSIKTTLSFDKCVCVTCSETVDNIQCWHFITRASRSTRWQEQNANGQCPKCNCWWGGRQYEHGLEIDKRYGEGTAERLVRLWHEPQKVTRELLEDIIRKFTDKIEDLNIFITSE